MQNQPIFLSYSESVLRRPKLIICISLFFYLLSLFLPAFTYKGPAFNDVTYDFGINEIKGWHLLASGPAAFFLSGYLEFLAWLANPVLLLSVFLFTGKSKNTADVSKAAFVLAVSPLFWHNILIQADYTFEAPILHRNSGYWLWLLSISILSLGIHFHTNRQVIKQ